MAIHKSYALKLGECVFRVHTKEDLSLTLHPDMEAFRIDENESPHIHIEVIQGVPEFKEPVKPLTNARYLPELSEKEHTYYFYTLNRVGEDFLIISGKEQAPKQTQRYAISDPSFRNWKVYISQVDDPGNCNPLSFPVGSLIFYYGVTARKGFMLHASGLNYHNRGYIFSGFSGVGKTTLSNFWLDKGARLINDDRLILMQRGSTFNMFNSPMAYPQEVMESPVHAIFILRQDSENKAKQLTGAYAFSRVASLCIQHSHDKSLVESLMGSLEQLVQAVSVYELGFRPDKTAVDYILQNHL